MPSASVPELAQVTRTLNNLMDSHNDSVDKLKRFVADVSHELRTPLAALVPVAEVLDEERTQFPLDSAEAAHLMSAEITNLTRLVQDLMEISRHDSHTATLHTTNTDIVAVVRAVLAHRGWSTTVTLDAPESQSHAVDIPRFEIIMSNLIANALAHGQLPVSVVIADLRGASSISVIDHGNGIPADQLPNIFDRFYKADTARSRSAGSGLGLALAAENTKLHGGTLTVASVPGRTIFTLTLPR